MHIYHPLRITAALLFSMASAAASAGLTGTTITQCTETAYTGTVTTDIQRCNPANVVAQPGFAVVGDGAEFTIGGNRFFDFGDTSLQIRYDAPQASTSPDLIIFTLQDAIANFTLVSANPLDITWRIDGKLLGILINTPGASGIVDFRFAVNAVPEPASLGLIALGLLGLARARRRNSRRLA